MDLPPSLHEQLLVHEQHPLGPLTTFGIGGPAPFVIEPRSRPELMQAVAELRAAALPFRVLGGGSNILVSDAGVDEIVIHTRSMQAIYHHGEIEHALRAEAGASLPRFVNVCQQLGLTGAEGLIGIPGSVGGAVVGNAGGRHGWIGERVIAVTVVDEAGGAREVPTTSEDFGYRRSPFRAGPERDAAPEEGAVVVDAVIQLAPADSRTVFERMSEVLRAKRDTQPLAARSAGCVFRNTHDVPSARLIDDAGCKGLRAGDAHVSERHGNFIINDGGARARDVLTLVEQVRERVRERFDRDLELEVELWGAP